MTYARNAWYVAAWSDDLPADAPHAISILGERIVVWRSASGALGALEDRCVHRLAPLSVGRCEGDGLRCMYHGFLYGPDGVVKEIPGQDVIPEKARVRRYPVVEKHSWIWVWMGDAAADPALIPPAVGFDDPDWILGRGQLDYAARARLVTDNLLDFSHLTYVHANSFGASDTFANELPTVSRIDRGVRFERWVRSSPGPTGRRTGALIDSWMVTDFYVPGVLLMYTGSFPEGTAQACGLGPPPDRDAAIAGVSFTSQAVTPMTEKTARYFFSWGPHRAHGDEALRDLLMGVADKAFGEDKAIIEAQQRVIDDTDDPRPMPTQHDRGVKMYAALVEAMIREERGATQSGATRESEAAE